MRVFFKVCGNKEEYDEYDVDKFLNYVTQNYKGSSVELFYTSAKWFYKIMNFDFGGIAKPDVNYDEINAVPLSDDNIKKLIDMKDRYSLRLRFFIALATTYGMRRIEMQRVTTDDINIEERKIYVRTAKSGKTTWRWMAIPDEIMPVLNKVSLSNMEQCSLVNVSAYFWKACMLAGLDIDYNKRLGWHAIRRALIVGLTNEGLSDNLIITYMRWKNRDSASSILYRYRRSQENNDVMENVDKRVFESHPFLGYWRDGVTDE